MELPNWQRSAIAAFACLGLLMKPHFLLVPLAISSVECLRARSLKPLFTRENWTIGCLALAYLGFVVTAYPEYLSNVVPLARATYWAYGWTQERQFSFYKALAVLLPIVVLFLVQKRSSQYQLAAEVLLAVILAFLAAFILQDKGFAYHQIPMKVFAALFVIVLLFAVLEHRASARAMLLSSLAAAVLIGAYFLLPGRYQAAFNDELRQKLGARLEGQKVMGFSIHIEPYYPYLTEVGARWVLRYPCLWPLPAAAAEAGSPDPEIRGRAEQVLDKLRRDVADDLRRHAPAYVLAHGDFFPHGESYISFLSEDPGFAEEWRSYRKLQTFGAYEVWRRHTDVRD
ncbi:MAG: hypothetical protein H0T75_13490 [Rhizobiales bacterium]|nr:hypothetical protein [Hyphomicrobiales bacterium]